MLSLLLKLCKLLELDFSSSIFPNKIVIQKKVIEDHEPLTLDNILYLRLLPIATLGQ